MMGVALSQLSPQAFGSAPRLRTREVRLELSYNLEHVSIKYSADDRYLFLHDTDNRDLIALDLLQSDPVPRHFASNVLGYTTSHTDRMEYLVTSDGRVLRTFESTRPVASWELIAQLALPTGTSTPFLLNLIGKYLAICSESGVVILDTDARSAVALFDHRAAGYKYIERTNVRLINGRICAEWIEHTRNAARPTQTYYLYDCVANTEIYRHQAAAGEWWFSPLHYYDMGITASCPEQGLVWIPADSLTQPYRLVRFEPFRDRSDIASSKSGDSFVVQSDTSVVIYQDWMRCASLPRLSQVSQFEMCNDRRTAICCYESLDTDDAEDRVTGVWDYISLQTVGRAVGHINGAVRSVSASSRYLCTVYTKSPLEGGDWPGVPNGTVVITDLHHHG